MARGGAAGAPLPLHRCAPWRGAAPPRPLPLRRCARCALLRVRCSPVHLRGWGESTGRLPGGSKTIAAARGRGAAGPAAATRFADASGARAPAAGGCSTRAAWHPPECRASRGGEIARPMPGGIKADRRGACQGRGGGSGAGTAIQRVKKVRRAHARHRLFTPMSPPGAPSAPKNCSSTL